MEADKTNNNTAESREPVKLRVIHQKRPDAAAAEAYVTLNGEGDFKLGVGGKKELTLTQKHNVMTVDVLGECDTIEFDAPESGKGEIHISGSRFATRNPLWGTSQENENLVNPETPESILMKHFWLSALFITLALSSLYILGIGSIATDYGTFGIVFPIVFSALSVLLIGASVLSVMKYRKVKRKTGAKLTLSELKVPLLGCILGGTFVLVLMTFPAYKLPEAFVNAELAARCGGVLSGSGENGEMPENPRYVFYNEEKNCYIIPKQTIYINNDAEFSFSLSDEEYNQYQLNKNRDNPCAPTKSYEVNLVVPVSFDYSVSDTYQYVWAGTRERADTALDKTDSYRVIRIDNGAVVASGRETEQTPAKDRSTDINYDVQRAVYYKTSGQQPPAEE